MDAREQRSAAADQFSRSLSRPLPIYLRSRLLILRKKREPSSTRHRSSRRRRPSGCPTTRLESVGGSMLLSALVSSSPRYGADSQRRLSSACVTDSKSSSSVGTITSRGSPPTSTTRINRGRQRRSRLGSPAHPLSPSLSHFISSVHPQTFPLLMLLPSIYLCASHLGLAHSSSLLTFSLTLISFPFRQGLSLSLAFYRSFLTPLSPYITRLLTILIP